MASDHGEDDATQEGCDDLRHTDGAIEQTEISAHVTISLQGIGDKCKRHSQHGSPGTTDQQERDELQILVVDIRHKHETYGTDHQTERVSQLGALELRQQSSLQ